MFEIALEASIRITVAAAVVALALAALRIRASEIRHRAWVAVLFAMLAMPILSRVLPPIVLPIALPAIAYRAGEAPAAELGSKLASDPQEFFPRAIQSASSATAFPRVEPYRTPAASDRHWIWPRIAIGVYLAGLAFLLFRFGVGLLASRHLSRSLEPVGPGVFESSAVAAPLLAGLFRPRVVLPLDWRAWADDKLRAVLAHERAHIARRDPLVGAIARLNCALFWFHPVSWWLRHTLAATAEEVCDDIAVRAIGERRRYAEVLLDIAQAVRRRGRRLLAPGLGVGGNGRLGARIDRVLQDRPGRPLAVVSVALTGSCAATIFLAAACQRQFQMPPPLQEDEAVVQQVANERARRGDFAAARAMTADIAASLEADLLRDPKNVNLRRRLLFFYVGRASEVLGQSRAIEARRRHLLWLIDNAPDSPLLHGDLGLGPGSSLPDPEGYDLARARWLAVSGRPEATTAMLVNAAAFFRSTDASRAEQLLHRAIAGDRIVQPGLVLVRSLFNPSPRADLGALYARILIDSAAAPEEQARIRKSLEDSTDVELLATVGTVLTRISGSATGTARVVRELGESYRNRAAILEPQSVAQRVVQRDLVQELNWDQDMQTRLVGRAPRGAFAVGSTAGRDEFLRELTDIERLAVLPRFAEQTYAEGVVVTSHPGELPTTIWERAAGYARDALSLADRLSETPLHQPVRYQAHLVLSVVELRAGRREESVTHLLNAARLAPSERLASTTSMVENRLVAYLLKYGERASIVEFLERTAVLKPAERDERLASIEALKQNRMPAPYQRILTLDGQDGPTAQGPGPK